MSKNIVIIGGGPGGYTAAIRAAQLGAQVTLIEKGALGGTCLNRGCVPTKVLLQSAEVLAQVRGAAAFGVSVEKVSLDFPAVSRRKEAVVKKHVAGVGYLMRKNKIKVIAGTGTLIDSRTVGIAGGSEKIKADNIIIATGSRPAVIPVKGIDEAGVINSDEALAMEQLPASIVIIGGGVIGLEFAQILGRMGCKVCVLEMMSQVLPAEDDEIARAIKELLIKEGIEIITGATVTGIANAKQGGKVVSFTTKLGGSKEERTGEKVLLAVGRVPNTGDLGVEKVGLALGKGRIIVNENLETNLPGVYAIGDVIGGIMLAHVAMEEGKCAAENCLGGKRKMDYLAVPRCVYTSPEVAAVGLTETEARQEYGEIKVGRFPFSANARASIENATAGMVKVITESKYGQVLGVHILGHHATELVPEAVLGIKMEATFEDIASSIHAHPTLAEAVAEAALDTEKRAINI